MATIILNVESKDNSSAVMQRVAQSIQQMNRDLATNAVSASQVLRAVQQQNTAYTQLSSAQDRLAVATRNYQLAADRALSTEQERQRLASTLGTSTNEYATASNNAAMALDRQATAGLKLADTYRQVATAQDRMASASSKLGLMSQAPSAQASGGNSREGSAAALAKNFLLYGVGYQLGFAGVSAFENSVTNNKNLSTLAGQTVASTSMNPADVGSLQDYARKQAGSGNQQYSPQSTLAGLYGFLSQGFSKRQALSMNSYALGLSQIAGSPDTTQAATALLSLGNGFGWGKNTGASAGKYANLLQAGANIGAYSLGQISQSLPNAGLAGLSRVGFDPRFVMSAVASGSFSGVSPEETAQNLNSLGQSLAKPTAPQRRFAGALGVDIMPGAFGRAGGAMNWFQTLEQHMSAMSPSTQQYMLSGLFGNQSAGRIASEMLSGSGPRSMASVYAYMGKAQQGQGFYQQALNIENKTPGQQLADSEAKLSAQFDNLTKSLVPIESQLVGKMQGLVDAIQGMTDAFGKGNMGNYVEGALTTLNDFITPGSAGFMNISAARNLAYTQMHPPSTAHAATEAVARVAAQQSMSGNDSSVWATIEARQRAKHPGTGGGVVSMNDAALGLNTGIGGPSYSGPGAGTLSGGSLVMAAQSQATAQQYAKNASELMQTTGRSTTTSDMSRFAAMVHDAILSHQSYKTVESALGLYKQAVNNNPVLPGAVKTEDILKLEKTVDAYIGSVKNSANLMPFHTPNPGMGGIEAGFQNTVARFGGGPNAQQQLILKLEQQLAVANRQIQLLQEIVNNTQHQKNSAAHTNPLQGTGTNRLIAR